MNAPPQKTPPSKGATAAGCGCFAALAVLIGLIVMVATSDSDDDTAAPAASSKPAAAAPAASQSPGLSKRRLTELSVDLVWDGYSETRRDILCAGVETNGPGWFADQLESDNLDHEYAGQLIEAKCDTR